MNINTGSNKKRRKFTLVDFPKKGDTSGIYMSTSPKEAATRAFRRFCEKRGIKNEKCKLKFAIKEITIGSNNKVYKYEGSIEKLSKPRVVINKNGRKVVHKYKSVLKAIS